MDYMHDRYLVTTCLVIVQLAKSNLLLICMIGYNINSIHHLKIFGFHPNIKK